MIPKLYSKLQYAVKNLIQDNLGDGPYCLTTDIWSSAALESYLSVTMHFITQDFQRKMVVLRAFPYDVTHSGRS